MADIYRGVKAKELQANETGINLRQVTFPVAAEVISTTNLTNLDFGSDVASDAMDLSTVITGDVIASRELAVVLTSNYDIYNLRCWATYNNFDGGLEIRYAKGAAVTADPNSSDNNDGFDDDTAVGGAFTHPQQTIGGYGANEKIPIPGTLEAAQFSDATYGTYLELDYTKPYSDRVVLQVGAFPATIESITYDVKKELDTDGYTIPLGHLNFYGEFADYKMNFQLPQGFSHLFALLPSFEVNLVDGFGVERTLGFLEDTVSMNFSTTTADNMSGYPSTYQSIIVTQRNSEITGNLSDIAPDTFARLSNFSKSTPLDTSGNPIGTIVELGSNTTLLPDYGIVLRGWFQNQVVVEFRFPKCKAYMNGNVDVHHVATRVPFTIVPVSNGTMYVGANKGFVFKTPIVMSIIPS